MARAAVTHEFSPEAACEAQLGVLAAVQETKKQMEIDKAEWTKAIVDMGIATVKKNPNMWASALALCVALDGFWNTTFAHTATSVNIAVETGKDGKEEIIQITNAANSERAAPAWFASVFEANEVHEAYKGLDGVDKGNAIFDIRTETEKRPVPYHLQIFVDRMRDLEKFGGEFETNYWIFEDTLLLNSKTKATYGPGDFGKKAGEALSFLRRNMKALADAGRTGPPSTPKTTRLSKNAGAAMSALRGSVHEWSDMPPNTPTLVAMQRLLVTMSTT